MSDTYKLGFKCWVCRDVCYAIKLGTAHLGSNPYTSTACFLVLMLACGAAAHCML